MGSVQLDCSEINMRAFVLACVAIAAVSADSDADAYTIGQVAAGLPFPHAVAPYHAVGYAGVHHFGKRSADSDADAYTIGQVAAGLPFANAVATGHAHNPGYIAYTSYPTNNVYNTYSAHHVSPVSYGYGAHHGAAYFG